MKHLKKIGVYSVLLGLASLCTFALDPTMENAFRLGSQHESQLQEQGLSSAMILMGTNPEDLPAYTTDAPPESEYSEAELISKGEELLDAPLIQQVVNSYDDKEAIGKDPNTDPVAARGREAMANADELAGDAAVCLEEKCFDESYQKSEDFASSVAEFSVGVEGGNSYSQHKAKQPAWRPDQFYTVRIYSGQYAECKKDAYDYSNCCDDSGWGNDWGLVRCSAEDKELYSKKQQGLCHTVATYEDGDWWDKEKIKTHCCFSSKLARITQEQGRPQIGKSWGSAESPNCSGFTEEEFERLNFDEMDLSEYEQDILNSAVPPDPMEFNQIAAEAAARQAGIPMKEGQP